MSIVLFKKGMTPMKTLSASDERTRGQERTFRKLVDNAAENATDLALEKVHGDREAWQKVLTSGDKVKKAVVDAVLAVVVTLCQVLLRFVTSASIPSTKEFILTEEFLVSKCGVRKAWIGDNFRQRFVGKTCKATKAEKVAVHALTKNSVDDPIREELGKKQYLTIGQFLWLLQQQAQDQSGVLLTNGYANIFYVLDDENVAWAVSCGWDSNFQAWGVEASSVANADPWSRGYRVFSSDCEE